MKTEQELADIVFQKISKREQQKLHRRAVIKKSVAFAVVFALFIPTYLLFSTMFGKSEKQAPNFGGFESITDNTPPEDSSDSSSETVQG